MSGLLNSRTEVARPLREIKNLLCLPGSLISGLSGRGSLITELTCRPRDARGVSDVQRLLTYSLKTPTRALAHAAAAFAAELNELRLQFEDDKLRWQLRMSHLEKQARGHQSLRVVCKS